MSEIRLDCESKVVQFFGEPEKWNEVRYLVIVIMLNSRLHTQNAAVFVNVNVSVVVLVKRQS